MIDVTTTTVDRTAVAKTGPAPPPAAFLLQTTQTRELSDAAYAYAREVETGEPIVVGVYRFPARTEPLDVLRVNPALEEAQVPSLAALRERCDTRAVAALVDLTAAAQAGDNLMPECIDAIRADATVEEMVARLRSAHGPWTPSTSY